MSIFKTFHQYRHTRDGRIVKWGAVPQLPLACYLFVKASRVFPEYGAEQMLIAGSFHLFTPVVLIATFVRYGAVLNFRKSAVLTVLLVLQACVPFVLSLPHLP